MIYRSTGDDAVYFRLAGHDLGEAIPLETATSLTDTETIGRLDRNGFRSYRVLPGNEPGGIRIDAVAAALDRLVATTEFSPERVFFCSETIFGGPDRPITVMSALSDRVFANDRTRQTPIHVRTGYGCANASRAMLDFCQTADTSTATIFVVEVWAPPDRFNGPKFYVLSDGALRLDIARVPMPDSYRIDCLYSQSTHGIAAYSDQSIQFLRQHRKHAARFKTIFREATGKNLEDVPLLLFANYGDDDMPFLLTDLNLQREQIYRPTLGEIGHVVSIDTYLNLEAYHRNFPSESDIYIMSLSNYFWDFLHLTRTD